MILIIPSFVDITGFKSVIPILYLYTYNSAIIVLCILHIVLSKQLKLHLITHGVTLCFTYTVDGDDLQTIIVNGVCLTVSHRAEVIAILATYIYIYIS